MSKFLRSHGKESSSEEADKDDEDDDKGVKEEL